MRELLIDDSQIATLVLTEKINLPLNVAVKAFGV